MQIDINSFKPGLRNEMKKLRQELDPAARQQASQKIANCLSELGPIQKAQTIMGFAPIQNEVDLIPFLESRYQQGQTILLPRVEDGKLVAVEWTSWQNTALSAFGIREPLGPAYPLEKIEVVLLPGLAFDGNGYRLGYGKGYYDGFLPLLKQDAFKCGVCYEFQVVDNIFPHAGDIPMHWIVTEKSELLIDGDFF